MPDWDSLSDLLSRHRGLTDRPRRASASRRRLDDRSKARILDASLGVLAALRALTDVTEEVIRERRSQILERPHKPDDPVPTAGPNANERSTHPIPPNEMPRQHIPLSY